MCVYGDAVDVILRSVATKNLNVAARPPRFFAYVILRLRMTLRHVH